MLRLSVLNECECKPSKSVFPESIKSVGPVPIRFYEYPLFHPPLEPQEASQNAKEFIKCVCEALEELHSGFNIAHLDVKLANICIDNNMDHPGVKLIDLDRSQRATLTFGVSGLTTLYRESVMYKADDSWTLQQVDWRQVGIMAFAFLNGIIGTSYHSTEPEPNSDFLHTLVRQGNYIPGLYEHCDPAEDTIT